MCRLCVDAFFDNSMFELKGLGLELFQKKNDAIVGNNCHHDRDAHAWVKPHPFFYEEWKGYKKRHGWCNQPYDII